MPGSLNCRCQSLTDVSSDIYRVEKDLRALQGTSYSLKGSAATVGVWRVREECHTILCYSRMRDETRGIDLDLETTLRCISDVFSRVTTYCEEAETELKSFYDGYKNT